jgi:hypothetical protein
LRPFFWVEHRERTLSHGQRLQVMADSQPPFVALLIIQSVTMLGEILSRLQQDGSSTLLCR